MIFAFFDWGWGIWDGRGWERMGEDGRGWERMGEDGRGWKRMREEGEDGEDGWGLPAVFEEVALGA